MEFSLLLAITSSCGDVKALTDAQVLPIDASSAMCAPTAKFDTPMPVPGLETFDGGSARLSPDELTFYFSSAGGDLYVARRVAPMDAFGTPTKLSAQSSTSSDVDPEVTSDGLTLWFGSNRVVAEGYHLYVATRTTTFADFGSPALAAIVNSLDPKQSDIQPFVTTGGELWFTSTRTGGQGGYDIWHSTVTPNGLSEPVVVPELNSPAEDWFPTLSSDGLTIYFTSTRPATGTKGGLDIWRSHRSVLSDGFPAPTLVNELNTAGTDYATWLSTDNCRMYGFSDGGGVPRMYVATRRP